MCAYALVCSVISTLYKYEYEHIHAHHITAQTHISLHTNSFRLRHDTLHSLLNNTTNIGYRCPCLCLLVCQRERCAQVAPVRPPARDYYSVSCRVGHAIVTSSHARTARYAWNIGHKHTDYAVCFRMTSFVRASPLFNLARHVCAANGFDFLLHAGVALSACGRSNARVRPNCACAQRRGPTLCNARSISARCIVIDGTDRA